MISGRFGEKMKTDIDNNLKKLVLERREIYKGDLILVNRQNPLQDIQPDEYNYQLIPADDRYEGILLKKTAANMLSRLMTACRAGDSMIPVSGFRSTMEQQKLFMDSLRKNGEEFTFKYVAFPNHSEHQTGLAIDMAENKETIDFICPSFPYEGICQSFRELAPGYGFIERYQKGREGITGISHEPWHFRYVGYPHSLIIHTKGFTLEEYIDFLKGYPCEGEHLIFRNGEQIIEIYYLEASTQQTGICIEDIIPYQISGNNVDGFIITIWRNGNG